MFAFATYFSSLECIFLKNLKFRFIAVKEREERERKGDLAENLDGCKNQTTEPLAAKKIRGCLVYEILIKNRNI